MITLNPAVCTAHSAALGLILQALGAEDIYDYLHRLGLPELAVGLNGHGVIVGVTDGADRRYAVRIAELARGAACDVVVLRLLFDGDDLIEVRADLALGLLPGRTLSLSDHALWMAKDQTLWLVPPVLGPAVAIGPDGLSLELQPPCTSMAERSVGLLRAADAIARIHRAAEPR